MSLRTALDSLVGDVKGSIVSICHIGDGVVKFCEYDDPIDRYQWRKFHDVVTYTYEQNYGHPFPNGVSLRMASNSLVGDVKGSIVSISHIRDGVVKFCEYDDPIDRYQWRKFHDVVAYTNRIAVIHFQMECRLIHWWVTSRDRLFPGPYI